MGGEARKLPQDLSMPLPKGADIVLASHFHPSGKVEMEKTTLGLHFADKPPHRKSTFPPVMRITRSATALRFRWIST